MGFVSFIKEMLKDVPFFPTTDERLTSMITLTEVKKGQKMVDLGSGDGKVVIAFAKLGAKATGIEIDPKLVELSRKNINDAKLANNIEVKQANFFIENYSEFDIVTIYGTKSIMGKLERKLKKELKPGAKVLLNHFKFPKWQPSKKQGEIYLYIQN